MSTEANESEPIIAFTPTSEELETLERIRQKWAEEHDGEILTDVQILGRVLRAYVEQWDKSRSETT